MDSLKSAHPQLPDGFRRIDFIRIDAVDLVRLLIKIDKERAAAPGDVHTQFAEFEVIDLPVRIAARLYF